MEARVAQLEKQYEKIDGKLDRIADAVARVDGRLAKVEGRVETLPTAKDFETFGQMLLASNLRSPASLPSRN